MVLGNIIKKKKNDELKITLDAVEPVLRDWIKLRKQALLLIMVAPTGYSENSDSVILPKTPN